MDTWLEEDDVERLFRILNEELSEDFTTYDEVMELQRLVDQAIANKLQTSYNKSVCNITLQ